MSSSRKNRNRKLTIATRMKMQQVVRLALAGKEVVEIANLMGISEDTINDMMRHPLFEEVERRITDKVYEPADGMLAQRNASKILEEASPDAAEALIALLQSADDVTRRQAATNVLDRAGFGPIQRKAVRKRIELDPVAAMLIAEAMKESEVPRVAGAVDAEVVDE